MALSTDCDPFSRGLDYLYQIRALAIEPDLIQIIYQLKERIPVCTWIGSHIDTVNAVLQQQMQACQACFHPWEQRSIQILPLLSRMDLALMECVILPIPPSRYWWMWVEFCHRTGWRWWPMNLPMPKLVPPDTQPSLREF
ncbi:MAG: hypothetical protein HC827_08635 [Cyanobacteria bacterium RM1_2_2]|nr:hypothetical protein [Cyanobacteria bacterium RM1_2_2]